MNREIADLREVVTKLVPMLAGKGLKVTQRGSQAYVQANAKTNKPELVNIPSIPDTATSEFISAISGFIDHEVAHVLFTDWQVYGGDGVRVDKFSSEGRALTNTHNIIEDTFIEREIVKTFPGSKYNLAQLHQHFVEKITKKALEQVKGDKNKEFSVLFVPMVRALSGQQIFNDFMEAGDYWNHEMIKDIHIAMSDGTLELIKKARNTQETLQAAQEIHDILFNRPDPEPEQEEPEGSQSQDKPDQQAGQGDGDGERDHSKSEPGEDEGEGGDAPGDNASQGGKGDKEDKDAEDAGDGGPEDNGDGSNSEDEQTESEGGGEQTCDAAEGEDEANAEGDPEEPEEDACGENGEGEAELRPEEDNAGGGSAEDAIGDTDGPKGYGGDAGKGMFDLDPSEFTPVDLSQAISNQITEMAADALEQSEYNVFTRDEDKIETFDPDAMKIRVHDDWVPQMEDCVRGMVGKMQKDIERMMASQSFVIRTPGHRRGRLHAPSLYRVPQNDPRVFTQREVMRSKDTAVTLLVDNSGSMAGAEIVTAMQAAYALASTLERVSIPNEVLGFTTGNLSRSAMQAYRDDPNNHTFTRTCTIVMPVFKVFKERITPQVKRRFATQINVQAGMNTNVDGESLEYAALRMLQRPEKRKVMLVMSDGQPVGTGTKQHLKSTVDKLTKMGIETVGMGIHTNAVQNYYPRHMVLKDVHELPAVVMSELRRILQS